MQHFVHCKHALVSWCCVAQVEMEEKRKKEQQQQREHSFPAHLCSNLKQTSARQKHTYYSYVRPFINISNFNQINFSINFSFTFPYSYLLLFSLSLSFCVCLCVCFAEVVGAGADVCLHGIASLKHSSLYLFILFVCMCIETYLNSRAFESAQSALAESCCSHRLVLNHIRCRFL